jgi:hypothetical protein
MHPGNDGLVAVEAPLAHGWPSRLNLQLCGTLSPSG